MIHAFLSAIFCSLVGLFGIPAFVCLLPAAWYMGREVAQAEYRYIEEYCGGKRDRMPWYAVFTSDARTVKGVLDWLLPALMCLCMWAIIFWIQH